MATSAATARQAYGRTDGRQGGRRCCICQVVGDGQVIRRPHRVATNVRRPRGWTDEFYHYSDGSPPEGEYATNRHCEALDVNSLAVLNLSVKWDFTVAWSAAITGLSEILCLLSAGVIGMLSKCTIGCLSECRLSDDSQEQDQLRVCSCSRCKK